MFFSLEEIDALAPYISHSKEKTIKNLVVAVRFFSNSKQSSFLEGIKLKISRIDNTEYLYLYNYIKNG